MLVRTESGGGLGWGDYPGPLPHLLLEAMRYRLCTLLILTFCMSITFALIGAMCSLNLLSWDGHSRSGAFARATIWEYALQGAVFGVATSVILSRLAMHGFRFSIQSVLLSMLVLGLITALNMERWRARQWQSRAEDARSMLQALGAETEWRGDHGGYTRIERKANIAGPDTPTVFDTAHGLPAVEPNPERRDAWLRRVGQPALSSP